MDSSEKTIETLEVHGEVPCARFGHTTTALSKELVILFGGAIGDMGKYTMSSDTYAFHILTSTWSKLDAEGIAPSPRAAHASIALESLQMIIYGGATGGKTIYKYRGKPCFR